MRLFSASQKPKTRVYGRKRGFAKRNDAQFSVLVPWVGVQICRSVSQHGPKTQTKNLNSACWCLGPNLNFAFLFRNEGSKQRHKYSALVLVPGVVVHICFPVSLSTGDDQVERRRRAGLGARGARPLLPWGAHPEGSLRGFC